MWRQGREIIHWIGKNGDEQVKKQGKKEGQ